MNAWMGAFLPSCLDFLLRCHCHLRREPRAAWVQSRVCEQRIVLLLLKAASSERAGMVFHQLRKLWAGWVRAGKWRSWL